MTSVDRVVDLEVISAISINRRTIVGINTSKFHISSKSDRLQHFFFHKMKWERICDVVQIALLI